MSCVRVTNALVHTVESTCSLSNDSMISVELNSHADIFVVSSNVPAVHNHEHFIDVYGFDKETWHVNACTIDAVIAHKDPVMHLTVILIINQAIKVNIMHNILIFPMKCCVHFTIINVCPKFLSASPAEDNHALLVHDPDGCSPPLTILLSFDGITSYFKARCPSLVEYEDKNISKYHHTSKSPLWDPSTSFYFSQEDGMVDYRGHLIAKLSMDSHSSDMAISWVVSASYMAADITDNENFATVLGHHVKVDMTTAVNTVCFIILQQKLAIDSDMLAWH